MAQVEQSLLEQLRITGRDIERRRALFGIGEAETATLQDCRDCVADHLDEVVDDFYTQQLSDPEIARIIGDRETLTRLRAAMRRHVLEMFSGRYGEDYVNSRLRIGVVHWRIGVTPKLFMAALTALHEVIKRLIDRESGEINLARARQDAVGRMMMFDSHLVMETYVSSLDLDLRTARRETEEYAASLEDQVAQRTALLQEMELKDPLTKLYRARVLHDYLRRELGEARRNAHPFAIVILDVRHFDRLKDSLGPEETDARLIAFADLVVMTFRTSNLVFRTGEGSFCVLMENAGRKMASECAERFSEALAKQGSDPLAADIGIASTGPATFQAPETLLKNAETALGEARRTIHTAYPGRSTICYAANGDNVRTFPGRGTQNRA